MNVIEIEESIDAIVAQGFHPNDFMFDFFAAYGAPKSLIKQLRGGQQDAFGQAAVLWRRSVHFQLSGDGQVGLTLNALASHKETERQKVRYIISTDGHDFGARDMKSGETLNCLFDELGVHFGFFLPLAGIERYKIADENPVDIKATGRLAKLYDSILQDNPTWKGDDKRHALNHFITQLVFCLFAEDTGILPSGLFSETIATYCESDSTQAQRVLTDVFTAMSLHEEARGDCPSYAGKFPHVNGGLFKGAPDVPRFTKGSVRYLIDAAQLNWKEINPDIFGSMMQSIVNTDQRGELGMHYTSVPNILKVLDPLFVDDMREQVNANWSNKKGLHGILHRLSKIRVFDPACGSGNFLVIAYRELRAIEIKVINRLAEIDRYAPPLWSHVALANFYGIEYVDFAAETAKLSLWIAEYQMNSRYEDAFGKRTPTLPLKETGNIVCGNALRVAWESVCPNSEDPEVETYIVGNPPYLGAKKRTEEQTADMIAVGLGEKLLLDYVCSWFYVARTYLRGTSACSFVATSSICQGEQVEPMWRDLFTEMEILYAHRPFRWTNNAASNAGVYCVIVSMTRRDGKHTRRLIFDGQVSRKAKNINAYLIDGPDIFVEGLSTSAYCLPTMVMGSNPVDGKKLILSKEEMQKANAEDPQSGNFLKRYGGTEEVLDSIEKYCIWVNDEHLEAALQVPPIRRRIDDCRAYRMGGGRDAKKSADRPHRFCYSTYQNAKGIFVPNTTSSRRYYVPAIPINYDIVLNHAAFIAYEVKVDLLALLCSRLHTVWLATVGGRLGDGFRYSVRLVYNTFPVPTLSVEDKEALTKTAEGILLARDTYFDKTIAALYDPDHMQKDFPELWEAHQRNDEVLETIYNGRPFKNDTERLEHLFARYSAMVDNK